MYYDKVFVDLDSNLSEEIRQRIVDSSDLVIVNTSQNFNSLRKLKEKKENSELLQSPKTLILVGRYDKFSKYNAKNLQRTERLPEVYGIPYNTLFFEACNEGNLADFMINYRKVKQNSVQAPIIESLSEVGQRIIEKLKELQVQV